MLTAREIVKEIEQNKDQIRALGVKRIALFGSYARATAKPQSDIDFLVEFEKGRGLFDDYVGLLKLLEHLFEKDVDLVKKNLVREELRDEILKGRQVEAKI